MKISNNTILITGGGSGIGLDLALDVTTQFPALNVVIHNAGVMVNEKITAGDSSHIASYTVATNLLGPIFLTNALLPHLLKQSSSTIMTVSSGLAYVPLAMTPTYSATKAAIHAYSESIRYQLKGTSVEVKELVPPYVQTTLMGSRQAADPNAMPLKDFIKEVMNIIENKSEMNEILVERVLPQRTASYQGVESYNNFFNMVNDRLMAARKEEWDKI